MGERERLHGRGDLRLRRTILALVQAQLKRPLILFPLQLVLVLVRLPVRHERFLLVGHDLLTLLRRRDVEPLLL